MRMTAFWPIRSPIGEVMKVAFGSNLAVPSRCRERLDRRNPVTLMQLVRDRLPGPIEPLASGRPPALNDRGGSRPLSRGDLLPHPCERCHRGTLRREALRHREDLRPHGGRS